MSNSGSSSISPDEVHWADGTAWTSNSNSVPEKDAPGTVGLIAGVCVGIIALLAILLSVAKFIRSRDRRGTAYYKATLPQRRTQSSVLPIHNTRSVRTVRRQSTDLAQGLPTYDGSQTDQLVTAFDLVSSVSHTEIRLGRSPNEVALPIEAEFGDITGLTLMQRMQRTQAMVNQLSSLTSAAPSGGYGEHSLEMMKIIQLRRGIAALMEVDHQSGADSRTQDSDSPLASREPGAVAPDTHHPSPSTLHHRMLQIQQLLSQIDDLVSMGSSSEETQNKIQELRGHIALLMDSNIEAIESRSSPGSSGLRPVPVTLSFPEPVHFASPGQSGNSPQGTSGRLSNLPVTSAGLQLTGGGEGSNGGRDGGNAAAGIQDEPPSYQAVVGTSEDGRAVQAAASPP
ncbi:hypothetical protein H1R20_g5109, partial [Candolleomyces eurysporus]